VESVPALTPETAKTKLTVLIVEDEFLIRWSAAEFLRERGYIVIEATSASDAMSIFDAGTHVDVVFSDINMPGEVAGHDLAQWLDRKHPNIPLLLTSDSRTVADKLPAGDKRQFITKPYELSDVEAAIKLISVITPR
jgi:DNA-binding NtrC family response regulator